MSIIKDFVSLGSAVNSDFFPVDKSVGLIRDFVGRREDILRANPAQTGLFANLKFLEEEFRQAFHAEESPFKVSNFILKVFPHYVAVPEVGFLTVKAVFFGVKLYFQDIEADEEVHRFFREKLIRRLRDLSMELLLLVSDFFHLFNDHTKVIFAELAARGTTAFAQKNKKEVKVLLQFITRFDLYHTVDVDSLLEQAVAGDMSEEAFHFAKPLRSASVKLLSLMVPSKHCKHMKQLIKSHGLDTQAFPQLFEYMRYGFFQFAVKDVGYELVEERACLSPADLPTFIRFLWHARLRDQAFSVFTRHRETVDLSEFKSMFSQTANFKYVDSQIRVRDDFVPASHLLPTAPKAEHFTMAELGYEEDQVTFVNRSNFDEARDFINNSSVVGIDSEFYTVDCTGFQSSELAIIQLATPTRVFVFDCLDLRGSFKFTYFIHQLLKNPSILKLAIGFDSDLRIFQEFFKTPNGFEIANLTNLEQLEKENTRVGLATLCEKYLLKKLCKREVISAWNQRPLRRAQLHYAALDAAILLKLHEVMVHKDRLLFTPEKPIEPTTQPGVSPSPPNFESTE